MPSLKEYNVKLSRLRSTRKLTRTMKLVSVNKLRRAQEAEKRTAQCAERLRGIVARLASAAPGFSHPLLTPPRAARTVGVIVFTSDRGLCGGFNHALVRAVQAWMAEREAAGRRVELSCTGRRGHAFFRARGEVKKYYEEAAGRPAFGHALQIGRDARAAFVNGRVDEVYLAFNVVQNALTQTPVIRRLLPLDPAELTAAPGTGDGDRWLFEPGPAELLASLLPRVVHLRIYAALQSSATGEHGGRMRAMDQATTNADGLIGSLTLQRNRARQAEITTELTEIVAGAEALK